MANLVKPLHYPIRAAARMTGLSVDTLRAWERRYGAVVPARDGRGRRFSEAHIARLQQLERLVKRGHPIGTIAGLSDGELTRLVQGAEARSDAPAPAVASAAPLIAALDRYDVPTIDATLNRFAVLLPSRDLVFAVVLPLLREVGDRWEAGTLRPAQEHVVSASVRSVLGALLRATVTPNGSPKIVFATPSGERHELGLLCAALLAASAGFGVVYLGADLPAADIVHAANTAGARVLVVSVTTPRAVRRAELETLATVDAATELWLGGPDSARLRVPIGRRDRRVATLADLVPMLERHAR